MGTGVWVDPIERGTGAGAGQCGGLVGTGLGWGWGWEPIGTGTGVLVERGAAGLG
jgi:hypothetical protein